MPMEGPRGARADELDAVVELSNTVFRPHERSMGREFPLLFSQANAQNLRVFLDDGRPVSMVGLLQREVSLLGSRHACCEIGSVCTLPEYRGQGLATRLLKDALERAAGEGCDLMLISGGRSLYTRQGFVDVGGFRRATVTPRKAPRGTGCRAEPWQDADLDAMCRLHAAEPVRFVRPPDDFRAMLQCGYVTGGRAQTRIVWRRDRQEPLAYLSFRVPGAKRVEPGELSVDEVAGSRWAVAGTLRRLFEEFEVDRIHLRYLARDATMEALARTYGWETAWEGFMGGHCTAGIIDPQRFWSRCAGLFAELVGPGAAGALEFATDGEGIRLRYGEDELSVKGMAEFTRLVFLPSNRRGELELCREEDSPLLHILSRIFPLPLVAYGLDYI